MTPKQWMVDPKSGGMKIPPAVQADVEKRIRVIAEKEFVRQVLPVETNILIFETKDETMAPALANKLREKGILSIAITPGRIRFVLHLDITDEMVEKTIKIISTL